MGIPSRTGLATTLMLHPRAVQDVAAPRHLVTVFELFSTMFVASSGRVSWLWTTEKEYTCVIQLGTPWPIRPISSLGPLGSLVLGLSYCMAELHLTVKSIRPTHSTRLLELHLTSQLRQTREQALRRRPLDSCES